MRINLEQGINKCQLIYDTSPNKAIQLFKLLDFTSQQAFHQRKVLILIDEETLVLSNEDTIIPQLEAASIDQLICVGRASAFQFAKKMKLSSLVYYSNFQQLQKSNLLNNLSHSIIVVKNTNNTHFAELMLAQLRYKCHPTVLEINLGAIEKNLCFFSSRLGAVTKIIAVVKAASYGNSHYEIAHFLQRCQVAYLAVAYVDEGVLLRENGIHMPIMVLNPTVEGFNKIIDFQLEPVVYGFYFLSKLVQKITDCGITALPIHIKLDTGMHRLGFLANEIETLIRILRDNPQLKIQSLYSHLAAAGTQKHENYTHQQASSFQKLASKIETTLQQTFIKHLLNTAGAIQFPQYQFDRVRIGIGLYGISSQQNIPLIPAISLQTTILQIKELSRGATVGYERKGVLKRKSKIAIIAIGYADGLRHQLGNGKGYVRVRGTLVPIIGNICMDTTMVDVTDVPMVQSGDPVIIFGEGRSIIDLSKKMNTIAHEVLTNLDSRIRRVYYQELDGE